MLDVLLIPAALLVLLALRAAGRGAHRLHGQVMAAALTVVSLRLLLQPRSLEPGRLALWLGTLSMAGTTLLLGRLALAWREGRSDRAALPRLHRAFGTLTLIALALATLVWLLRPHDGS